MSRFSIFKIDRHIQYCHPIGNKCTLLKLVLPLILLPIFGCEKQEIEQGTIDSGTVDLSSSDEFFQIAVLPDTQYYTALKHNGTMEMFEEQINWIRANKVTSKIAYVVHLGDVVDHGDDSNSTEWIRAKNELYKLEQDSIPYGVAVGNHDQTPYGNPASPGTNSGYGVYFGRNHMQQFPWYGGAYGSSNNSDNHYDLFSANGTDYIVLYIEYNTPNTPEYSSSIENAVMNWADGILNTYSSRKAIIVSHSISGKPLDSNGDPVGYNDTRAGFGNNSVASNFTQSRTGNL